jgi:SAM-dependent methyltransferase
MPNPASYMMENPDETARLLRKTDYEAVRRQAFWCGVKPGMRVLDAGCGPGATTLILHELVQPGGQVLGVDYSEERLYNAQQRSGGITDIEFRLYDLRDPPDSDMGCFDLIWVRFVLEYNRLESFDIVKNLTESLKPRGRLCLLDLDYNCLTHYDMRADLENILRKLMATLEETHNFDPYVGRKLFAYLYDLGFENIEVDLLAHHLIYGEARENDVYNWMKKAEVASTQATRLFDEYAGGAAGFQRDFERFFLDPRRFTYTPLIACKGNKPSVR